MKTNTAILALALILIAFFGFLILNPSSGRGVLEGKVTIGPLCPVERFPPDPQCQPTEETYKAWPIAVYTQNKLTLVAHIQPDINGNYAVELAAGNYVVNLENRQSGGLGSSNLPDTVTINANDTTLLNIDIDTGIR